MSRKNHQGEKYPNRFEKTLIALAILAGIRPTKIYKETRLGITTYSFGTEGIIEIPEDERASPLEEITFPEIACYLEKGLGKRYGVRLLSGNEAEVYSKNERKS